MAQTEDKTVYLSDVSHDSDDESKSSSPDLPASAHFGFGLETLAFEPVDSVDTPTLSVRPSLRALEFGKYDSALSSKSRSRPIDENKESESRVSFSMKREDTGPLQEITFEPIAMSDVRSTYQTRSVRPSSGLSTRSLPDLKRHTIFEAEQTRHDRPFGYALEFDVVTQSDLEKNRTPIDDEFDSGVSQPRLPQAAVSLSFLDDIPRLSARPSKTLSNSSVRSRYQNHPFDLHVRGSGNDIRQNGRTVPDHEDPFLINVSYYRSFADMRHKNLTRSPRVVTYRFHELISDVWKYAFRQAIKHVEFNVPGLSFIEMDDVHNFDKILEQSKRGASKHERLYSEPRLPIFLNHVSEQGVESDRIDMFISLADRGEECTVIGTLTTSQSTEIRVSLPWGDGRFIRGTAVALLALSLGLPLRLDNDTDRLLEHRSLLDKDKSPARTDLYPCSMVQQVFKSHLDVSILSHTSRDGVVKVNENQKTKYLFVRPTRGIIHHTQKTNERIMKEERDARNWKWYDPRSVPLANPRLSFMDLIQLNLMFPPTRRPWFMPQQSHEGFSNLFYCGRDGAIFDDVFGYDLRCGPTNGPNCAACRTLHNEDLPTFNMRARNVWQGVSGYFYCGRYAGDEEDDDYDNIDISKYCGPHQGKPCFECARLVR